MLRAIATAVLLLAAVPCPADDFDVNALYEKWKKEDSRTLEGWRVLDDPTLIEKLGPLGLQGRYGEAGSLIGNPTANYLLSIAHERGIAGAPCDALLARHYFSASARHRRQDGYAAIRPAFRVSYVSGTFSVYLIQELNFGGFVGDLSNNLSVQGKEGYAAAHLMHAIYSFAADESDFGRRMESNLLSEAAVCGCLPAMVILAQQLLRGPDVKRDVEGGLAWLKKAAEGGYVPAMLELARFHHYSQGQEPDLPSQRVYLKMAADAGDLDALRTLESLPERALAALSVTDLYVLYLGAWKAPFKAIRVLETPPNPLLLKHPDVAVWLKSVANDRKGVYTDAEIAKACIMYAECLRHGIGGVEQDTELARHWLFQVVSDNDYPAAQMLYSELLVGDAKVDDPLVFLVKAFDAGFRPAVRMLCAVVTLKLTPDYAALGFSFEWKRVFDSKGAVQKLEAFAEVGDIESMRMLVEYRRIAEIDWLPWAVKLANLGDGPCALVLADYHSEVDHADTDKLKLALQIAAKSSATREEALRRLQYFDREHARKRCAELAPELAEVINRDASPKKFLDAHPWIAGFAQQAAKDRADHGLFALCLQYGHGVSADDRSARKLYNLEDEDTSRIYLLARMMEQGYGGAADQRGAGWVYEALAKAGHGAGAYRLGLIRRKEKQDEKATELFKQAAEAGCLPAMVELAEALHDGIGTDKDADKAKEWAKKAAEAGDASAKELLDEWK